MIFVTVGTQLAFDRLVNTVDQWGAGKNINIFAQIGPSQLRPNHISFADFIPPTDANDKFKEASLIVSHAGMGSILTALKYKKPILIMPRRASMNEHRNDHQLATTKWLGGRSGIYVAWDERELIEKLNDLDALGSGDGISEFATPELIGQIKNYINSF